jgi:hypothetical protein
MESEDGPKVTITPESGPPELKALFNPNEYRIEEGNQIAEIGIPGLDAPILQFVAGQTRTLSMDLFFDTYEDQTDVSERTKEVYRLLEIVPATHAPPICKISWGSLSFRGVLDKVSGTFTLFLSNGTPVRAKLSVSFKEYNDVKVLVQRTKLQSADHRKSRMVRAGDSLSTIAFEEYGDAAKWRPIAEANGIDDPRSIELGRLLMIPALN